MSHQFFNNTPLKVHDPNNTLEHYLVDSIDSEHIEVLTHLIYYWKLDTNRLLIDSDEVDRLYMENEKLHYDPMPIQVNMISNVSPIVTELNRLGISSTLESVFSCNIKDIKDRLGRGPIGGDLFRISFFETGGKYENVFYKVSTINKGELFKDRYYTYFINANQTALEDVPDYVLDYTLKD
jgi:hypothetical protein